MTNKIVELNQNEISNVSGGLLLEMAVMTTLFSCWSVFKNWQNGGCAKWETNGWSSEDSCYATNAIEDGLFFGVGVTALGEAFHATAEVAAAVHEALKIE